MAALTQAEIYAEYREKVLVYSLPRYDAEKASLSTWIYQITRFTLMDYVQHINNDYHEDQWLYGAWDSVNAPGGISIEAANRANLGWGSWT